MSIEKFAEWNKIKIIRGTKTPPLFCLHKPCRLGQNESCYFFVFFFFFSARKFMAFVSYDPLLYSMAILFSRENQWRTKEKRFSSSFTSSLLRIFCFEKNIFLLHQCAAASLKSILAKKIRWVKVSNALHIQRKYAWKRKKKISIAMRLSKRRTYWRRKFCEKLQ